MDGREVCEECSGCDEIRSRGKLPILVGGTHYYTQSLLFEDALASEPVVAKDRSSEKFAILNEPSEVIMAKLREVDPVMADRWHVNDRRKIQRSLEIYLETGKPASQVYSEQRSKNEAAAGDADGPGSEAPSGPSLRFPTLVFWVHAPKEVLHPRLDGRIVKMLDRGLLSEVDTLTNFRHEYEAETGQTVDQSRGIWVSIGYKEFLDYQSALSSGTATSKDLEKMKQSAIEKTQAATRQYSKRQIRWISIKLLNALFSAGQKRNTFVMDGSNIPEWEQTVLEPAADITKRFLAGEELPDPSSMSALAREMLVPNREYDLSTRPDLWQKRTCEVCGTTSVTENNWEQHIKSRLHRRNIGVQKKAEMKAENARKREPEHSRGVQADVIDILQTYLEQQSSEEQSTEKGQDQ